MNENVWCPSETSCHLVRFRRQLLQYESQDTVWQNPSMFWRQGLDFLSFGNSFDEDLRASNLKWNHFMKYLDVSTYARNGLFQAKDRRVDRPRMACSSTQFDIYWKQNFDLLNNRFVKVLNSCEFSLLHPEGMKECLSRRFITCYCSLKSLTLCWSAPFFYLSSDILRSDIQSAEALYVRGLCLYYQVCNL